MVPYFAGVLDDTQNKKFYELNDGVLFFGDCIEYGSLQLFDRIKESAGQKFIEMI